MFGGSVKMKRNWQWFYKIANIGIACILLLLVVGCSEQLQTDDTSISSSISKTEDLPTTIRNLLNKGKTVFSWYMQNGLEYSNTEEPIEDARGTLYPVTTFRTINDLKQATETVFSKDFCEKYFYAALLENDDTPLRERNGRLYTFVGWQTTTLGENLNTDNITILFEEEDLVIVRCINKQNVSRNGKPHGVPMNSSVIFVCVKENDNWVLANYFDYGMEDLKEEKRVAKVMAENNRDPIELSVKIRYTAKSLLPEIQFICKNISNREITLSDGFYVEPFGCSPLAYSFLLDKQVTLQPDEEQIFTYEYNNHVVQPNMGYSVELILDETYNIKNELITTSYYLPPLEEVTIKTDRKFEKTNIGYKPDEAVQITVHNYSKDTYTFSSAPTLAVKRNGEFIKMGTFSDALDITLQPDEQKSFAIPLSKFQLSYALLPGECCILFDIENATTQETEQLVAEILLVNGLSK